MSYVPPHAPGSDEKFAERIMVHEDVAHWYHVYSKKPPYQTNTALGFNKGWGATRFAPIKDVDGSNFHTYYLASNRDGCYLESVLHDIPLGVPAFFDKSVLDDFYLAKLKLPEPIKFVSFHNLDLPALGLTRPQLIESLPHDYPFTRPWAEAGLASNADSVAIGYTSRRNDMARCLMVIEQRLEKIRSAPLFDIIEDECIGTSPKLRREVLNLVASLGISVL